MTFWSGRVSVAATPPDWDRGTSGTARSRSRPRRRAALSPCPFRSRSLTSIAASPTGTDTFIASQDGKPLVKEAFGNWFAVVCATAGVPGRAHGLRKALAVKLAEAGATDSEMESTLGNQMASLYRRRASDRRLAAAALSRLGIAS